MKLIMLNGPCGIGKSTVAKKLHESMPLSFLLDIDALRRNIHGYRKYNKESSILSREIARSIVNTCMENSISVILDKMIFDASFVDSLTHIATTHGATTHEIILWAPKKLVLERAENRGYRQGGLLTPEKCEMFWEKIDTFKEERRHAHIIDTTGLDEDEVFHIVKRSISS